VSNTRGLGPRPGRGDLFGRAGDDFSHRLARWSAEARADDAAAARARERWLRQQATEAATMAGVLVDTAERGTAVTIHVDSDRTHRGALTTVGHDVVALTSERSAAVFVAIGAITAVAVDERSGEPTGTRQPVSDLHLGDVFAELAAGRAPVVVNVRGGAMWSGSVTAAGVDVVTIRPHAGDRVAAVHLQIAAVVDVICR
jgi:hypothetical protein